MANGQPQMQDCYEKDPSMVFRQIEDEMILVPVRQNVTDLESIYSLNGVAARIWELVDGQRSVGDIKDRIVEEYEVPPEVAERDLIDLMKQLESIGAIRRI